ncbi:hypothetical protein JCM10213_008639 [Rhodosporidiobolus nylandii]
MTTYTGNLSTYRKDTLLAIHSALSLPAPPGRITKYALAEDIRSELKSNPDAREDPRFEGLWQHMPESRLSPDVLERHLAHGEAVDLSEAQEERVREGSVAGSAGGRSPRRSLDALYHHDQQQAEQGSSGSGSGDADEPHETLNYREAILHGSHNIVHSLLSPARGPAITDLAARTAEDGLALVPSSAATRTLRRRASRKFEAAAVGGAGLVGAAQERLSSPWVVVMGVVAAELAWVVWEAVPWAEHSFGPHPYAFLPLSPASYTYRLPVFSVLLHPTFLSALSTFAFLTLLLPLTLATLLAFPSRSSTLRKRGLGSPAPPNPLVFCLARAALAFIKGYVLAAPMHAPSELFGNLKGALREIAAGGPGALGLAGGRYTFEGAVEGYWGVMGVGMLAAAGIVAAQGQGHAQGHR